MNYEAMLNAAINAEDFRLIMEDYTAFLKDKLGQSERHLIRSMVDTSFTGYPKLTAVFSQINGGKSVFLDWLAANCFYLNEQDTITYYTELKGDYVIERLAKLGIKSKVNIIETPASREDLWPAIRSSALLVIDQPWLLTSAACAHEQLQLYRDSIFNNVKQKCRGILISAQSPRTGVHDLPVGSTAILAQADLAFSVNLRDNDVAKPPSIKTLKSKNSAYTKEFFQLPRDVISEINKK